jgi:hypothetical protein
MIYPKEKQTKEKKGGTRKIYRGLLAFYRSTIIPMLRWSSGRARFRLTRGSLLTPLSVDATPVLERLDVPSFFLTMLLYIRSDWIRNNCRNRNRADDSRFQDRRSLLSVSLHRLTRALGSVPCAAMRRKKAVSKILVPGQIGPSSFVCKTTGS